MTRDEILEIIDKHPVQAYFSIFQLPVGIGEDFSDAKENAADDIGFMVDNARDVIVDIGRLAWAIIRCLIYPVYRLYHVMRVRNMDLYYPGKYAQSIYCFLDELDREKTADNSRNDDSE